MSSWIMHVKIGRGKTIHRLEGGKYQASGVICGTHGKVVYLPNIWDQPEITCKKCLDVLKKREL